MSKIDGIYALVWTESGEILSPDSFKQYWPNYGNSGWRAPKKVYFTLGTAKAGFSHIPQEIKPLISIAKFSIPELILGGEELLAQQAEAKQVKEAKFKAQQAEYRAVQAQRIIEQAQKEIAEQQRILAKLR
jgi:hypothetical protein